MRILIELPTWLGDAVMATPAIENLVNFQNDKNYELTCNDLRTFCGQKIIDDCSEFDQKLKLLRICGTGDATMNKQLKDMLSYAGKKDIAEKLQVSAKTVATHRSRLMQKMGFSTNAELILYANKSGLLL